MIILSGYFRSGTTMLYYLAKTCNRDRIVLYEPDHDMLPSHLSKARDYIEPNQPIKIKTWEDYLRLPPNVLNEIKAKHVRNTCPFSLDEIRDYVDIYAKIDVVIKVTRWSFILGELIERYNAKVVHIVRNVYDVVASHLDVYNRVKDEDVFFNKSYFERIRTRFNVNAKNIVERIVVNWYISNLVAYRTYLLYPDKMMTVQYEDIVTSKDVLKRVEKFTGLCMTCIDVLKRSRSINPDLKKMIDSKLVELKQLRL